MKQTRKKLGSALAGLALVFGAVPGTAGVALAAEQTAESESGSDWVAVAITAALLVLAVIVISDDPASP